jgi:hypothetical protein
LRVLQKRYSAQDLIRLFVFCAFPIHVWAIIIMFRSVPAWLFYMSQSDFIASIAYHLTFTIFETLLAFAILLAMGFLIPRRWTPEPFLTLSSVLIVELSIMAIVFQQLVLQYASLRWMAVSCLIILAASLFIIPKIPKLQQITSILAERLTILTFLYVFFDVIGVIIVILRNL